MVTTEAALVQLAVSPLECAIIELIRSMQFGEVRVSVQRGEVATVQPCPVLKPDDVLQFARVR